MPAVPGLQLVGLGAGPGGKWGGCSARRGRGAGPTRPHKAAEAVSGQGKVFGSQQNAGASAAPLSEQLVSLLGPARGRNNFARIPGPGMVLESQQEQKAFFPSSDLEARPGPSFKASSLDSFVLTWGAWPAAPRLAGRVSV